MPDFGKLVRVVVRRYPIFLILFLLILPAAYYGYDKAGGEVYYNLGGSLPEYMGYVQATNKLEDEFSAGATHMILLDKNVSSKDVKNMVTEMKEVDGVEFALGMDSAIGSRIPDEMIPDKARNELESDNWKLLLVQSKYSTATDEVNEQIEVLQDIMKKYDETGMLIGEAPCTKDLIEITDKDFNTVSVVSIGVIFIIILLVFKSVSLPMILVAVIETAIFVNMGIPYYTGTQIPFIASVVIGTIQLGATVDYAILMTTRYRKERYGGMEKREAVTVACQSSVKSIVVSALSFFAATFGVGLYSNIDMISSLCTLMARGALISMVSVIFILPSMFMVFDKIIIRSGVRNKKRKIGQEAVSL